MDLVIETAQGKREAICFNYFIFIAGLECSCVFYGMLFLWELVIHFHLSDVSLDVLCLVVPHGVVKPGQPNPEPIKAVI